MVPLDIPVIACVVCNTIKTSTGATIADLHKLDMKPSTGPAAGNPAGTWARAVIPVYVCLDCTIELKLSDAECLKMVAEPEGISLAERHEMELAEAQQQEDSDGQS